MLVPSEGSDLCLVVHAYDQADCRHAAQRRTPHPGLRIHQGTQTNPRRQAAAWKPAHGIDNEPL